MNTKSRVFIVLCLFFTSCQLFAQEPYKDTAATNWFKRSGPGWNAGDATISVPLPNGQSIFLFGDTYLDQSIGRDGMMQCLFQVRNSAVVTNITSTFTTFLDNAFSTGVNRTPFKVDGTGIFSHAVVDGGPLWPAEGYVYGNKAYIFFKHIKDATWEFMGGYIAQLRNLNSMLGAGYNIQSVTAIGKPFDIAWGIETLVINVLGTDYLFIYGEKNGNAYLARTTEVGNPLETRKWEYWNGYNFATGNIPASIASGLAGHFNLVNIKGSYYLISQDPASVFCNRGRNINAYKSVTGSHRGPFSNPRVIWTVDDEINGSPMNTYNARVHPQFTNSNNELLISYNVNGICPRECASGSVRLADGYRPKFIRVPERYIEGLFSRGK